MHGPCTKRAPPLPSITILGVKHASGQSHVTSEAIVAQFHVYYSKIYNLPSRHKPPGLLGNTRYYVMNKLKLALRSLVTFLVQSQVNESATCKLYIQSKISCTFIFTNKAYSKTHL